MQLWRRYDVIVGQISPRVIILKIFFRYAFINTLLEILWACFRELIISLNVTPSHVYPNDAEVAHRPKLIIMISTLHFNNKKTYILECQVRVIFDTFIHAAKYVNAHKLITWFRMTKIERIYSLYMHQRLNLTKLFSFNSKLYITNASTPYWYLRNTLTKHNYHLFVIHMPSCMSLKYKNLMLIRYCFHCSIIHCSPHIW